MYPVIKVFFLLIMSYSVQGQYTIQDWYGTWSGDLSIMRNQDTLMRLPMSLEVSETDVDTVYNWIITYALPDKPEDRREYILIAKNVAQGLFILDEQNGIRMPMNMHGNSLFSLFDVMTTRLMTRTELVDDQLIYAIETADLSKKIVNPSDTISGNPEVLAWPVNSRHRAVLTRPE